ncbi:unnamed protein product [Protopolystoma xenopodis]|uniref:Uncharacterized protein n=1 Tax=Protopolystoma xenopodis TaxID=117903 RepID=A0A448WFP2_9PLAT|nr:unnamed protein product [Protopolystoma xenopodis]
MDYMERNHLTPSKPVPGQLIRLRELADPTWWRSLTLPRNSDARLLSRQDGFRVDELQRTSGSDSLGQSGEPMRIGSMPSDGGHVIQMAPSAMSQSISSISAQPAQSPVYHHPLTANPSLPAPHAYSSHPQLKTTPSLGGAHSQTTAYSVAAGCSPNHTNGAGQTRQPSCSGEQSSVEVTPAYMTSVNRLSRQLMNTNMTPPDAALVVATASTGASASSTSRPDVWSRQAESWQTGHAVRSTSKRTASSTTQGRSRRFHLRGTGRCGDGGVDEITTPGHVRRQMSLDHSAFSSEISSEMRQSPSLAYEVPHSGPHSSEIGASVDCNSPIGIGPNRVCSKSVSRGSPGSDERLDIHRLLLPEAPGAEDRQRSEYSPPQTGARGSATSSPRHRRLVRLHSGQQQATMTTSHGGEERIRQYYSGKPLESTDRTVFGDFTSSRP